MRLSPIEEYRQRMNQVATRRGMLSPSTQRISRVLDRLLTEWYQAVPADVLAAAALRTQPQERVHERFTVAKAKDDAATLMSLLPAVLALPADDPDRPQMLNCCSVYTLRHMEQSVPGLALAALEEAVATAPLGSLLHFKAMGNLTLGYLRTGRFHAAYFMCRKAAWVLREYPQEGQLPGMIYYTLSHAARWLGKGRLANVYLQHCLASPEYMRVPENIALVQAALFSRSVATISLPLAQQQFRSLYPGSAYQPHLLGSYAGVLLRHGHARAAIAVARHALSRVRVEHPHDVLTHMELLIILAAASHRAGNQVSSAAFLDHARRLLGAAALTRPATVRMQDWLAITDGGSH